MRNVQETVVQVLTGENKSRLSSVDAIFNWEKQNKTK